MLARIKTATLVGVSGHIVTVELDIHRGMPSFDIVGLADMAIKESARRIKPAVLNSGYAFPDERITVNLSPAGKHKEGSHFDLPIALGIVMLQKQKECIEVSDTAFFGEVSLDGKINRIRGALPLAICLRKSGIKKIVMPYGNAEEASILEDIEILPVRTLREAEEHVNGIKSIAAYKRRGDDLRIKAGSVGEDFSQVIGQESAKRAAVIGAAGNHGLMFMGGPGCGKTMIAKRIPTILPELTYEEKLEITGIHSVAGLLTEEKPVLLERPFRSPHHTITAVGLIGGGARPRPGELSLAHRGVLFLDELGEFSPVTIDAMRQPIEDGVVRIRRNMEEMVFPTAAMVVAAANPCKCGSLWDDKHECTCTRRQIDSHRRKLNGPFSDRIDIHVRLTPVPREKLMDAGGNINVKTSEELRAQVKKAVEIQKARYTGSVYSSNGDLNEKGIELYYKIRDESRSLLNAAYEKFDLTMRSYGKILKISRTIADIEGCKEIESRHVAEALQYRVPDWGSR